MLPRPEHNEAIALAIDILLNLQNQPIDHRVVVERFNFVITLIERVRTEVQCEMPNLRPLE